MHMVWGQSPPQCSCPDCQEEELPLHLNSRDHDGEQLAVGERDTGCSYTFLLKTNQVIDSVIALFPDPTSTWTKKGLLIGSPSSLIEHTYNTCMYMHHVRFWFCSSVHKIQCNGSSQLAN